MKRVMQWAFVVVLGAVLVGCASKPVKTPEATRPVSVTSGGGAVTSAGDAYGSGVKATPLDGSSRGNDYNGSMSVTTQMTIHFDYDSSEIKAEYVPIVHAAAKRLAADGSLHVRLEGHTDERGSAEYNIGLGERRAQAVRKALLLEGVSDAQLTTVSYGAERPVADGHNEAAWAQNRRVEIVDANR